MPFGWTSVNSLAQNTFKDEDQGLWEGNNVGCIVAFCTMTVSYCELSYISH